MASVVGGGVGAGRSGDWAEAQSNLADALDAIGERGDEAALRGAISAYRAALEVFTPTAYPLYARQISGSLEHFVALLARRSR